MEAINNLVPYDFVKVQILDFLNAAKEIEDLIISDTSDPRGGNPIIQKDVAKNILEARDKKHGGSFSTMTEFDEVKGVSTALIDRLVAVFETKVPQARVETVEPLFRFITLRYAETSPVIQTKSAQKKGGVNDENEVKPLSIKERSDLEKAHVATLAQNQTQFLESLHADLQSLYSLYNKEKDQAAKKAEKEHAELVETNIKKYLSKLSPAEKAEHEALNQRIEIGAEITPDDYPSYPSSLFPRFNNTFPDFSSEAYLSGKLKKSELEYLKLNQFFGLSFLEINNKLGQFIQEKRIIASYPGLQWRKTRKHHGVEIVQSKRYENGYVLSKESGSNNFFLSVVIDSTRDFLTGQKIILQLDKKKISAQNATLISNKTRLLTLKIAFEKLPDLSTFNSFNFQIELLLNSGKTVRLANTVSSHNDLWVGKYLPAVKEENRTKSGSADNHSGLMRLGWADLMRVEQQLCCYLPGEIAHIENIMAREYKEKSTEFLERSEFTVTTENETETIEKNDTTTVAKHDWNKEIQETIDRQFEFNLGTTVSYSMGPWSASINAGLSFSTSRNQSETNSETFSKNITETASETIRNRSFEKRSSTLIKQFKEENKHGFDNRKGDSHVSGIFRWIDKKYKNKVINYGKGMLYEFMVPKPSEFYVESLNFKEEENPGPEKPEKPDLKSWHEINRGNYLTYINKYGVSDYQPPLPEYEDDRFSTGSINDEFDWFLSNKSSATRQYAFPASLSPNYDLHSVANSSNYKFEVHNPGGVNNAIFQIHLRNSSTSRLLVERNDFDHIIHNGTRSGNMSINNLNFSNQLEVYILGRFVKKVNHCNIDFVYKLKDAVYQQWQQDTYNAIMDAYNQQLQEYNDAQNNTADVMDDSSDNTDSPKHPAYLREIVHTELKRLCIELLLQNSSLDRCMEYYESHKCNEGEGCDPIWQLDPSKLDQLDQYSALVKFLEQSFEWSLMSYNFYPYYWAGKCDWSDMLHNEDASDSDFQRFLKSGMARTIVPVREGFEKVVAYFLATGQPWFGGEPPTINDPLFVDIVAELTKPVGHQVGETWYTNVPSTLTLLQGRSTYLNEQGLPCCPELKGSRLLGSNNKLEALSEESGD